MIEVKRLLKIFAHDLFFLNWPSNPNKCSSALMGQLTKSKIESLISDRSSVDDGGRVAVKSECLYCFVYPLYMPGGRSETHCITYKI